MAAIRGAICAQNDAKDISARATELVEEIVKCNKLQISDICAVIFTCTADLDACYPAAAVRELLASPKIAYVCAQEMNVKGSLDHCIRVCVIAEGIAQSDCKHRYLGKAAVLRSDLA